MLLALQLFEQFGAHFAALQHVQQVGDGAKEGKGDGGFAQGALPVQLLQQKFDAQPGAHFFVKRVFKENGWGNITHAV